MTPTRPGVWIGGAVLVAVLAGAWLAVIWHAALAPASDPAPAGRLPATALVGTPVATKTPAPVSLPASPKVNVPEAVLAEQLAQPLPVPDAAPAGDHPPERRGSANYPRHGGR